jgi:hypothetical protein
MSSAFVFCCWVFVFKDNYKVKITGHVKGIGDDATMEGNTQQQIATDLKTILPEHSPRKVSVHRSYQHILYDPRLQ